MAELGADPGEGDWMRGRRGSKLWVNRQIETNAVPVIWTTNAVGNIDPAILRRMSFVLRLDPPAGKAATAMIERIAQDEQLTLPPEFGAGLEATEFFRPDDETFPFGTHVAVVEVFPDTGEVQLQRYLTVDDCGVIVSPKLVRGQVHGGVAQGVGQALLEEIVYDPAGELLTGTLNDYAIPRAVTFPAGFAGSQGYAEVPAIASTTLDVLQNGASSGSITFGAGSGTASFSLAADTAFAPGDRLAIVNQDPADATLADLSITLKGSR